MNRDEIKKKLNDLNYPDGRAFKGNRYKALKESIIDETSFMDDVKGTRFSSRAYCILNDIYDVPSCPACGDPVHVTLNASAGLTPYDTFIFCKYCSRECARSDPDRIRKAMDTMTVRYGDHNMRTEEGKKKQQDSLERNWGVRNPMHDPSIAKRSLIDDTTGLYRVQTEEFKEKSKDTLEKNWVNGNHMKDPEFIESMKRKNIERWGVSNHTQRHIHEDSMKVLNDKDELQKLLDQCVYMKFAAIELGVHQSSVQRACSRMGVEVNQRHKSSIAEIEIRDMISHHFDDVEMSNRSVLPSGSEMDIYIPSRKIGIEFNGLYWHSDKFRDKKYHQMKSLEAKEQGIQLIHVWEDDWKDPNKKKIVKKKIMTKLGLSDQKVYARKTSAHVGDYKEAHQFMTDHHIQGKTTASCWIFLRDQEDNPVACMGMKKLDSNGKWDLVRYATSKTVVGGFSKCLKFFQRNYDWCEIITYAALDYSHGNVYSSTGFSEVSITVPGMWYVKGDRRFRREKFMKHKLKDKLEGFDENLTEKENMTNHGFLRLYDAGSIKYSMVSSD